MGQKDSFQNTFFSIFHEIHVNNTQISTKTLFIYN